MQKAMLRLPNSLPLRQSFFRGVWQAIASFALLVAALLITAFSAIMMLILETIDPIGHKRKDKKKDNR